jgi:hypothetical protein
MTPTDDKHIKAWRQAAINARKALEDGSYKPIPIPEDPNRNTLRDCVGDKQ